MPVSGASGRSPGRCGRSGAPETGTGRRLRRVRPRTRSASAARGGRPVRPVRASGETRVWMRWNRLAIRASADTSAARYQRAIGTGTGPGAAGVAVEELFQRRPEIDRDRADLVSAVDPQSRGALARGGPCPSVPGVPGAPGPRRRLPLLSRRLDRHGRDVRVAAERLQLQAAGLGFGDVARGNSVSLTGDHLDAMVLFLRQRFLLSGRMFSRSRPSCLRRTRAGSFRGSCASRPCRPPRAR